MYNLQNFPYKSNPEVPVSVLSDQDGNILFDASHVCSILGYVGNASDVVRRLDDDEKRLLERKECDSAFSARSLEGGAQQKWFIYESGLFKLILRSNKAEAKAFTRWVTHEVLPAIRRTGGYHASGQGEVDMVKVQKTHHAAYKVAMEQGKGKVEARKVAREQVKRVHQVDIYELLGMEPPKEVPTIEAPTPDYVYQVLLEIAEEHKDKCFYKTNPTTGQNYLCIPAALASRELAKRQIERNAIRRLVPQLLHGDSFGKSSTSARFNGQVLRVLRMSVEPFSFPS